MVKVILGTIISRIDGFLNRIVLYEIEESCSYEKERDSYANPYGWDGIVRKFNRFKQTFPTGLSKRVFLILKKNKIKYEIIDNRPSKTINEEGVLRSVDEFRKVLRPYHIDGIIKGLKTRDMMYWWATSSGKTVLFAFLIKAFDVKTLVMIHRNDILEQHIKTLEYDIGQEIGKIAQGLWNPQKITIATVQSLWSAYKNKKLRKKLVEYLASIEYLVFDEAHHAEARTWKKMSKLATNTKIRHGFSGTAYSLDSDDMELECVTGPVRHKISLSNLIKWGYICKPIVRVRWLHTPEPDGESYHVVYREGVVNNEELNDRAVIDIMKNYNKNRQILVTVRIVKHGHKIKEKLIEAGILRRELEYLHGGVPQEVRMDIKDKFERKKIKVLIVSAIWNEGVDVPSANVLIKLDGGGGANVRDEKGIRTTVQQVGRVLRKEREADEYDVDTKIMQYCYIYDYYLMNHKWLKRHSKNRLLTYKMEPEFIVKEIK